MKKTTRVRRRVGDVVEVPLGGGSKAYGLVLPEPLIAFFDYAAPADTTPSIAQIAGKQVAFRIWVMNVAVTRGRWPVIGNIEVPEPLREPALFFRQDALTGALTVMVSGATETPADHETCARLECAAVWSPEHVEDRLRDHFAGLPNAWVESLRPRLR